jgi:hypothetical protein
MWLAGNGVANVGIPVWNVVNICVGVANLVTHYRHEQRL